MTSSWTEGAKKTKTLAQMLRKLPLSRELFYLQSNIGSQSVWYRVLVTLVQRVCFDLAATLLFSPSKRLPIYKVHPYFSCSCLPTSYESFFTRYASSLKSVGLNLEGREASSIGFREAPLLEGHDVAFEVSELL